MKCVGPTLASEEIDEIRKSIEFSPELEEAAELFNLTSNSTRLKILFLLDELKELESRTDAEHTAEIPILESDYESFDDLFSEEDEDGFEMSASDHSAATRDREKISFM